MKKLISLSFFGMSLFFGAMPARAEWDYWAVKNDRIDGFQGIHIYQCIAKTNSCTLKKAIGNNGSSSDDIAKHYVDGENNIIVHDRGTVYRYNISDETVDQITDFATNYDKVIPREKIITSDNSVNVGTGKGKIKLSGDKLEIVEDGFIIDGEALITKNSDGTIQIGLDGYEVDLTDTGLSVKDYPLITYNQSDNTIHFGKNSLITTVEEQTLSDGRKVQPLYAQDADGNKIPINIDGSKLLIDGVEVTAGDSAQVTTNKNDISTNTSNISTNSSNIKNLGEGVAGSTALTAALSALPQTSKESKLSCGVGTGAYSSRYALGFGCASKVNERVDINAGGSYVFGGSKSYGEGTLDNGVIKTGFVFKLGELNKPTQISMKDKKVMETKIESLEKKNKTILSKNQKLENKLSILMARLEKIEKIALGESKSKDLAVYKLQ